MIPIKFTITLGLMSFLSLSLFCLEGEANVTRQEIQQLFHQSSGNAVRTRVWMAQYLSQPVFWQGEVVSIRHRPKSHRLELFVKVLAHSFLYDTMVVLEGETHLNPAIQKGSVIQFEGRIFNGVDSLGVKEVQVVVPSVQSIRLADEQWAVETPNGKTSPEIPVVFPAPLSP